MLSNEDIVHFNEDGYLVFERLIEGDRLAYYLDVCDELVARGNALTAPVPHFSLELGPDNAPISGLLHKVQGVCQIEARILALACEQAIVDRVAALLGAELDCFGTKFFPKLAAGTSTHWHQDNYYFGTTSDQVISCGIYLQDADLDNGCLQIVPGSHLSGEIAEHQSSPSMHGSWTQIEEAKAVALPMPAGTVALFSANLLHGTVDNQSERTRYSMAWHYIPGELNLENFPRGDYEDRHLVREG